MAARHILILALVLGACAPRVGNDCPPEADALAHTIVYRRDGLPAYAGQALMITSCGGGAFCHSEAPPPMGEDPVTVERYGAPFGLDFVPQLADQVPEPETGMRRLRNAQLHIWAERDAIYASVRDGSMPPGVLGRQTQLRPYFTFDDMDRPTPIDGLDTAIGRETLRNWLACNAPLIESTTEPSSAVRCSADSDCLLTGICNLGTLRCVPVGVVVGYRTVPVDPTWSSIYEVIIESRCATGRCHGGSDPRAGLDFSDRDRALELLLGQDAAMSHDRDAACEGEGRLVVPGDPGASLLYRKLTAPNGASICGDPMPLGGTLASRYQDVVRDWIMAGAPP